MTFSKIVKQTREQLHLSQEALARELGVSFSTINRWENDKSEPNFLTKKAFINLCNNNGLDLKIEDIK